MTLLTCGLTAASTVSQKDLAIVHIFLCNQFELTTLMGGHHLSERKRSMDTDGQLSII